MIQVNLIGDKHHEYFKYGKFRRSNQKNNLKNKTQMNFFPNNVGLVTFHVNTSLDYNKRRLNTYIDSGTKIIVPYPHFSYTINKRNNKRGFCGENNRITVEMGEESIKGQGFVLDFSIFVVNLASSLLEEDTASYATHHRISHS